MAKVSPGQNKPRGPVFAAPRLSILDRLSGDANGMGGATWTPHLPDGMVAGSVPYVAGSEDQTVWNAAVQACGTERVHYTFTTEGGRCWYLAVPSASLASYPNAWCPLTACLPGNPEYWDRDTVYIYEHEGQVGALRWEPETSRIQLFMGATRTTLPRIQSLDASFVTINSENITPIPWRNQSLRQDQMSRAFGRVLVLAGVGVACLTFAFLVLIMLSSAVMKPKLDDVRAKTTETSMKLMEDATGALKNNTLDHLARVQELLDTLIQIQGTLLRYEVKDGGAVEWEALLPKTYSVNDIPALAGASVVTNAPQEKDNRARIRGTR